MNEVSNYRNRSLRKTHFLNILTLRDSISATRSTLTHPNRELPKY